MLILNERFEGIVGSDIIRDGMYLEVFEVNNQDKTVLEIFYSDITKKFSISLYKENVDLELIEESIKIAKLRLVPTS